MKRAWALETPARLLLFGLSFFSAAFAAVSSVEFSYNNFIAQRILPSWALVLADHHSVFAAAAALLGLAALPARGRKLWLLPAAAALILSFKPGLAALRPGTPAELAALWLWLPYGAWEAAAGAARRAPDWKAMALDDADLTLAGALAGLIVAASYGAGRAPAAWAWSLCVHAAFGGGAGLILESLGRFSGGRRGFALAALISFGAAAAAALYVLALLPLGLPSSVAAAFAVVLAAAGALCWHGQASLENSAHPAPTALHFLTSPLRRFGLAPASRTAQLAAVLVLLGWRRLAAAAIGHADWNLLIATLAGGLLWAPAGACALNLTRGARSRRLAPLILLALASAASTAPAYLEPALRWRGIDARNPLERLAERDVTLRALARLSAASLGKSDFYSYLQRSTNIARSIPIAPKDIVLTTAPPVPGVVKPNIFIVVIDSLRQDYVGAYNPAARFTPAIDAFAKDAWVFRSAFTAYGATGLSEPSIWAGARLVHKQYVLPFSPMNSLEKLLLSEGYYKYVSVDPLLAEILAPRTVDARLDEKTSSSVRLCGTVDELLGRLDSRPAGKPIFVYTQPQDIHVSVIQSEGAKPVGSGPFEGFHAPYASRLARLDACFGRLVDGLKTRGLYDDSIILLTSDHGDSLGEEGRWGHAYTLFPEILRVPLVMRVPERLRKRLAWDLDAPAFLIDVTPTLYALLGRPPEVHGGVFGRSLVDADAQKLSAGVPKSALEVSSYGPVYALFRDGERRLYIADGVNYKSYLFELRSDPKGLHNLADDAARAENEPLLRSAVEQVNDFYGFKP